MEENKTQEEGTVQEPQQPVESVSENTQPLESVNEPSKDEVSEQPEQPAEA